MKIIYFSLIVLVGSNLSSNKVEGLRAEKIHGGTVVKLGWFTYVVALMYKSETLSDENPCAGTIIDDWHIATAAHCFYDKRNGTYRNSYFYIIPSLNNLKKPEPWTRRIQVDILFIPSSYQSTGIDTYFTKGDLAIVKLKEEFGLYLNQNTIKKLNIPQRPPNKLYTSEFNVAGYGWHEIHFLPEEWNFNVENIRTGKSDGKMRYAKATVLNTTECQYIIGEKIAEGNMCAKLKRTHPEKPIGICQYDSGDPLTHISYLNGIVINGFMDCDDEKMPGIYIDILYYRSFIEHALRGIRTRDMHVVQLKEDPLGQFKFEVL